MSRIGRWVNTLQPPYLFTLPVLLGAAAEFGLGQLASPYSRSGSVLLSAALYLMAVVATFAILGFLDAGLRRRIDERALRTVLLIAIPVSAAVGGALLGWARYSTGLDPTPLWTLRITSTVVNVAATSILLWFAVSGVRLHYERLDALAAERNRLEALRAQASRELTTLNTEATEAVRRRILRDVGTQDSLDAGSVLTALTSTLEDTVRPLSRQLESESPHWSPPEPEPRGSARIDWRAAAVEGASPALLNPIGVLGIVLLLATVMNLFRVGVVFAAEFAMLTILVALPLTFGLRWVFVRITGETRTGGRVLAFVGLCLVSGLTWGAMTLPITLGTPQPLRFVYLCPLFTLIIAFIWGFALAAQTQALSTEGALRAATDELRWGIARKQELYRQQQRALAHAVHGDVQAALAAGILELDRAIKEGRVTDEQVRGVQARIVDCVQELDLRNVQPSSLTLVAQKVQATWSGVLTLQLSVDPRLEASLPSDPQCLTTLNDVIPELAFNSIKHGRATTVDITLEQVDERTIRLVARDDGTALESTAEAGLGSRLLSDCAIEWSRHREDDHTVTTVLLPFAAVDASDEHRFKGEPSRVLP